MSDANPGVPHVPHVPEEGEGVAVQMRSRAGELASLAQRCREAASRHEIAARNERARADNLDRLAEQQRFAAAMVLHAREDENGILHPPREVDG